MFDPETLSATLTWQEFEILAENAFQSLGFKTTRNFRIKKPRTEIDLLAWHNRTLFAIDCKHWKRTVGYSTMTKIGEKQISRCQNYLDSSKFDNIIPLILTWHDESLSILENGVPIVPIYKISDFVLNFDSSSIKICQVRKRRQLRVRKKPEKVRRGTLFSEKVQNKPTTMKTQS